MSPIPTDTTLVANQLPRPHHGIGCRNKEIAFHPSVGSHVHPSEIDAINVNSSLKLRRTLTPCKRLNLDQRTSAFPLCRLTFPRCQCCFATDSFSFTIPLLSCSGIQSRSHNVQTARTLDRAHCALPTLHVVVPLLHPRTLPATHTDVRNLVAQQTQSARPPQRLRESSALLLPCVAVTR